jgi:hypothetical protein
LPRTPDSFPGVREDEGLILIDDGYGEPQAEGGIRYSDGYFFMKDQYGVFNPRDSDDSFWELEGNSHLKPIADGYTVKLYNSAGDGYVTLCRDTGNFSITVAGADAQAFYKNCKKEQTQLGGTSSDEYFAISDSGDTNIIRIHANRYLDIDGYLEVDGYLFFVDDDSNIVGVHGNFDMGGNNIIDVNLVDGVDVSNHNSRHIRGGLDEINGDTIDIDYVPANYIRDTSPSQVTNEEHLTAHLAGIDGYLSAINRFGCIFWDDFLGNDINTVDWNTDVLGATSEISTPYDLIGGQLRLRSGSTSGDYVSIDGHTNFSVDKNLDFKIRFRIADVTNSYTYVGMVAPYSAWFERWQSNNWYAKCDDSSGETSTDLGFGADTSFHEFRIICSTGQIQFYVDDTLEATHTTNIPSNFLSAYVYMYTTVSGSVRDMFVDWVEIKGDR